MKYLLDTHIVLWLFDHVEKLSEIALGVILKPAGEKYVSIVSAWEVAIKISLGKLTFDGGVENFLAKINENGFELLPVKEEYIGLVREPCWFPHKSRKILRILLF